MGKLDDVMRSKAAWGLLGGGMTTPMAIGSVVLLAAGIVGVVNGLVGEEFPVGMLLISAVAAFVTLFAVRVELARIREVRRRRRAGLPVPSRGGLAAMLVQPAAPAPSVGGPFAPAAGEHLTAAPTGDPITHLAGQPLPAPPATSDVPVPPRRRAAATRRGEDGDRDIYLGGERLSPERFQERLERELVRLGQHRSQAEAHLATLAPADALLARRALVRDGSSAWLRALDQGRELNTPAVPAAAPPQPANTSSAWDPPIAPRPAGAAPVAPSTDRADQRGRANRALGR